MDDIDVLSYGCGAIRALSGYQHGVWFIKHGGRGRAAHRFGMNSGAGLARRFIIA